MSRSARARSARRAGAVLSRFLERLERAGSGEAVEDLILKIRVEGDAKEFAWIIPFPNQPVIKKEKREISKTIVKTAYDKGSIDNITVVAIHI